MMPRLRSGKVVTASHMNSERMVTSPCSLGAGTGCKPGKKLVVEQSPCLAPKGKPKQSLSSCLQPAMTSSVTGKPFFPLVSMEKEKGVNSQRLPGKKTKVMQCRRAARSNKGVALPISDIAVCEDRQASPMAAAVCREESVRKGTGQGQQLCLLQNIVLLLQNKLSGIERKEHSSEELNLSGFQESSGSSGDMEVKLHIPSSEGEIDSTESYGISCLLETEVLKPRKDTCSAEMKSTDSIMILKRQIPDLKINVGTQASLTELKLQEKVDIPEKLHGCSLIGTRKPETQEKGKRCLSKKGEAPLMKLKLQGCRERDSSVLLELHTRSLESKKGAVSLRKRERNTLLSQQVQSLRG